MSVLDQIRKLEEQKAALLSKAKEEALATAQAAIASLNELGFHYQLVQQGQAPQAERSSSGRRSGVRNEVLRIITEHQDGIGRAQILELMDAKGDKRAEQSISNALANLKKAGTVTADAGLYKSA